MRRTVLAFLFLFTGCLSDDDSVVTPGRLTDRSSQLDLDEIDVRPSERASPEFPGRVKIEFPHPEFHTLQMALDAAPSGAVVEIKPGFYSLSEPLYIRNKNLVLAGSGSGRHGRGRVTHLAGPAPDPVEFDGEDVSPAAEVVEGVLNLIAAEVIVQDMKISGFNAGIVIKEDSDGNSAPVQIQDVIIEETGRGVLSFASNDLLIKDCEIVDTNWHAVSVRPTLGALPGREFFVRLKAASIANPRYAGVYCVGGILIMDDVYVGYALGAGVVTLDCKVIITDSFFEYNHRAGIILSLSRAVPVLRGNIIENTLPDLVSGKFGDGIVVALSTVNATDNTILNSARAGISNFGGTVRITDNIITCYGFPLAGEPFAGSSYQFANFGGVCTTCGSGVELCYVATVGLEPPTAPPP